MFTKITTNALAQTRKRGLMSAVGDYDNDGDQDHLRGQQRFAGSGAER